MKKETPTNKFIVETDIIRAAFKKLQPFMSKEEPRYYLQGIALEFDGTEVIAVAMDGHKLGVITLAYQLADETQPLEKFRVIIPAHTIAILLKALPKKSRVIITAQTEKIIFDWEFARHESSLIEGNFPDFRRVIPECSNEHAIAFNPKYMSQICKGVDGAVKLFIKDDTTVIKVTDSDTERSAFYLMPMRA